MLENYVKYNARCFNRSAANNDWLYIGLQLCKSHIISKKKTFFILIKNIFINECHFCAATSGPINEPPLPRRKKNPELAYRSHEFIGGIDRTDSSNRARVSKLH